jgi:hypothetical protein
VLVARERARRLALRGGKRRRKKKNAVCIISIVFDRCVEFVVC